MRNIVTKRERSLCRINPSSHPPTHLSITENHAPCQAASQKVPFPDSSEARFSILVLDVSDVQSTIQSRREYTRSQEGRSQASLVKGTPPAPVQPLLPAHPGPPLVPKLSSSSVPGGGRRGWRREKPRTEMKRTSLQHDVTQAAFRSPKRTENRSKQHGLQIYSASKAVGAQENLLKLDSIDDPLVSPVSCSLTSC
ncbi:PREDICTED: uncharacterized protein LOC106147883 isoform X2 [Chinchilla lanigera]|uniref:uncharacterized protein LOC106147883 isoform X2 n=1 Tax=Chinchilla lanigera TaxID=34839 RepID=UPI000697D81F|nr:PREDICTED: uncharacterized protein LOC106147883 isoform X2 [Chinchilla lanigera]